MKIILPFTLTERDYVSGIQGGNPAMERHFYNYCRRYYEETARKIFADDNVSHEDFFQDAFVQVWTEIQNGRIHLVDGVIYRVHSDGKDEKMTSMLKSFLITIVRNQYAKSKRHITVNMDKVGKEDMIKIEDFLGYDSADKELKQQVVDDCVADLPARCKEILTLFYFKKKSLDEILRIRQENSTKDGLKTAKSKCMRQLKGRVIDSFRKYNISLC